MGIAHRVGELPGRSDPDLHRHHGRLRRPYLRASEKPSYLSGLAHLQCCGCEDRAGNPIGGTERARMSQPEFDRYSPSYEELLKDPIRDRFTAGESAFFHVRKRDL